MIDCKYKALHKIRLFIADPSTRINFKFFFFNTCTNASDALCGLMKSAIMLERFVACILQTLLEFQALIVGGTRLVHMHSFFRLGFLQHQV